MPGRQSRRLPRWGCTEHAMALARFGLSPALTSVLFGTHDPERRTAYCRVQTPGLQYGINV